MLGMTHPNWFAPFECLSVTSSLPVQTLVNGRPKDPPRWPFALPLRLPTFP